MNSKLKIVIGALTGAAMSYILLAMVRNAIARKQEEEFAWPDEGDQEDDNPNHIPFETEDLTSQMSRKNKAAPRIVDYSSVYPVLHNHNPELVALAQHFREGSQVGSEDNPPELLDRLIEAVEPQGDLDAPVAGEEEPIVLVNGDVFFNSFDEYQIVELLYYPGNDLVTDKNGTPMHKIERLIGDDALVEFGVVSKDPDIVYVINHDRKRRYEITRKGGDYIEADELAPRRKNGPGDSHNP